MGRTYPVVIGAMVLALASWVVSEAFSGEGGLHDYEVTALNKDWKIRLNQDVKVAGIVVENSLRGDLERLDVEFDIEDQLGGQLTIAYKKLLPDPFDYGREVIVEGKVVGKGKLDARTITVKCPSRYQDGAMPEEEMPDRYRSSPLSVRAQNQELEAVEDMDPYDQVDLPVADENEALKREKTSGVDEPAPAGVAEPPVKQIEAVEKAEQNTSKSPE